MTDIVGTPDPAWLSCFPDSAVEQVVGYVARSWAELVTLFPRVHHAGEREPVLTKSLADYLDDPNRRRAGGIGGRFHAERPVTRRRAGRVKAVGRTDVEYHYPAPGSAALTLEFKKLQGTHGCRSAYRNKGIVRFLTGTYGREEARGVMCGLVTCSVEAEAEAIRASIGRCREQLACLPLPDGDVATEAWEIESGATVFETHHRKATITDPFRLSHVFMALATAAPPTAPPAADPPA
ncbi:MAG: hypothetical protein Q8Q88_04780 [Phenylobacterium sp.]|uniref:hypothetical protein n=1 Tax=Phenylobacterium sp. TaxID=1871053 RepID=UPI0027354C32|nr:hypothetical protein [Phenylobacterium sp.]MDP3746348.1 hypothetical protein [Phenylobacterium sp.]